MMDAALKMRQLRYQRRQQGRCIYCGGILTTATMCERHAEAKRRSNEPLRWVDKKRYPVRRKAKRDG